MFQLVSFLEAGIKISFIIISAEHKKEFAIN